MPQDPTIQAMLISYDKTAQRLMDGEKIEGDELYRFLGVTGVLSVQMQRQLWTQEELRQHIKDEQKEQCKSCANSKAIEVLMASLSAKPSPPSAPESPQNVWTMLATSVAQNMRVIVIVAGISVAILGVSIVFTRQITEAAGFVTTAAQAANGGK